MQAQTGSYVRVGQVYSAGTNGDGELQKIRITKINRKYYFYHYYGHDRRITDRYDKKGFENLLRKGFVCYMEAL